MGGLMDTREASFDSEQVAAAIYAFLPFKNYEYGICLRAQVSSCWDFCKRKGWKISYIFIDKCQSEERADEQDLSQIMKIARAENLDVIVFWRFSKPNVYRINHVKVVRHGNHGFGTRA